MRFSGHLALVLLSPGLLSGCALLKTLGLDAAAGKTYNNNDMNAARDAGNAQLLGDMCMQKVKASVTLNDACNLAAEAYAESGDFQTLTDICGQGDPGQPYEAWFNRTKACNYAGNAQASQDIQLLADASCGELERAFETASGALAGLGDRTQQNDVFRDVANKAVQCDQIDWFIEEVAHWGTGSKEMGYAAIEAAAGAGIAWEETFFAYVDRQDSGPLFSDLQGRAFLDHYLSYLVDTGATSRCEDYIGVAERVEDISFGPLNWYFRTTGCTVAIDTIGKRLSSERHKTRQFACKSLAELGGSQYKRQVLKLASDDPYYWLKDKDDQGRPYLQPVKVYDVRDECGAAAIRL